MKKNLFLLIPLLCLASCNEQKYDPNATFVLDEYSDSINLHSELQEQYLSDFDHYNIENYCYGSEELSRPMPVKLSWDFSTTDKTLKQYKVYVSKDENFSDSWTYCTENNSLDVYNFELNTEYYWKVEAECENYTYSSDFSPFQIENNIIRNIFVDGVTNFRDLGGYQIGTDKIVKQGLIYRCGRLNESSVANYNVEVTESGKEELLSHLKIKSEIDLRSAEKNEEGIAENGGITSSPLGESVKYLSLPMEWKDLGSENLLTYNEEAVKKFFEYISVKENYPVIFHCNIGTDRTGLLAYMLNGLLGVSEKNIEIDYLFSNFGKIGSKRTLDNIQAYANYINGKTGNSLSEKIQNVLLEIGVSQDKINSIKSILIDPVN